MADPDALERAGRYLFRRRGLIGTAGFLVVFALGRPDATAALAGLPLLCIGLALRVWAMGYIGADARAGEVGARRYVGAGPYRWFRLGSRSPAGHPLYFGNFLLVTGFLVCLRPPVPAAFAVVLLFLLEYLVIARAEERFLKRSFGDSASGDVRFELRRARPEWRTAVAVAVGYGLVWLRLLAW